MAYSSAVANQQAAYNANNLAGITAGTIKPLKVDGIYGPLTQAALGSSNSNNNSNTGISSNSSQSNSSNGNSTPTYGSTGASVSAYQQQLNQQNAGQAGYVPLKVDGIYGPLTRAASQFGGSGINQPIGSAFNFSSNNYIPNLPTYTDPEKSVDQGKIRSDIISQFQDRIDSLNNVYNSQLKEARNQAKDLTGSTTAILAARGLTGSMRGQTIAQDAVSTGNKAIQAINAQKSDAIQGIYQTATELSYQEAQRRRDAITSGAKNYIEYLKTQTQVKQENLSMLAQQFIAQNVDPSTLSPQELQTISKELGVTAQDIIGTYQQEKFKAAKTVKKTGTSGSGSTARGNQFSSDLDAIIGNTLATIPSKFGQEQFNNQISRARNDADKISTVASVVLKNAPAEVKRDFSNQSIAISNIDKAIRLIDEKAKTGIINNAKQYVFNVFGRDYDPNLAAISSYITAAVQPYRNSVTGAAWGDQEEAEYASLFGSTKYSPTELKARLARIKEIMRDKSAQGLNVYVNPLDTYSNPFANNQTTQTQSTGTQGMVTVYSTRNGAPAQIPQSSLQQALASGLFRQ